MTANELQCDLTKEIEKITKEMQFATVDGNVTQLKAYQQSLPLKNQDDELNYFPYCIVRIRGGEIKENSSVETIGVTLIIGVYDNDKEMQGYKTLLDIITKIVERFRKNSILNNQSIIKDNVEWTLQDEDTYPFFIAVMQLYCEAKTFVREDDYA